MGRLAAASGAIVFALALALVVAARTVWAQPQTAGPVRVGLLIPETVADQFGRIEVLRAGLVDRGGFERRNLVFELRSAEGEYNRRPALAAELASLKVDVIVASAIGIRIPQPVLLRAGASCRMAEYASRDA